MATGRLERFADYKYRVKSPRPGGGGCVIFGSDDLLPPSGDNAVGQLENVAMLPGLIGPALAMPDIHEGYGFPIGGVAAFDLARGVISPGGVGYDINCGVRLYATDRHRAQLQERLAESLGALYKAIPSGLGVGSRYKLGSKDLLDLLSLGAKWCVKRGTASDSDLDRIEDGGRSIAADPDLLSPRALERGAAQLGTLGSGNHFLELQHVEKVFDAPAAAALGLAEGMVTIMIHTGSRGLGYQVCDDFLATMKGRPDALPPGVKDPHLVSAPIGSPLGRDYFAAMMAAANYAWANRQVIGYHVGETLRSVFGKSGFAARLVYDVAHNLARRETVAWDGRSIEALVHRKGATRALAPGDPSLPAALAALGQPVIIPGDMGSPSWVLLGLPAAARESFATVSHGAGRALSRKQALKSLAAGTVLASLAAKGITLMAGSKGAILEEAPAAYKNVNRVVEAIVGAGLARAVARVKPLGVIKG